MYITQDEITKALHEAATHGNIQNTREFNWTFDIRFNGSDKLYALHLYHHSQPKQLLEIFSFHCRAVVASELSSLCVNKTYQVSDLKAYARGFVAYDPGNMIQAAGQASVTPPNPYAGNNPVAFNQMSFGDWPPGPRIGYFDNDRFSSPGFFHPGPARDTVYPGMRPQQLRYMGATPVQTVTDAIIKILPPAATQFVQNVLINIAGELSANRWVVSDKPDELESPRIKLIMETFVGTVTERALVRKYLVRQFSRRGFAFDMKFAEDRTNIELAIDLFE